MNKLPIHLIGKKVHIKLEPSYCKALSKVMNNSITGRVTHVCINDYLGGFKQVNIERTPIRVDSWEQISIVKN